MQSLPHVFTATHVHVILTNLSRKFELSYSEVSMKKGKNIVNIYFLLITEGGSEIFSIKSCSALMVKKLKIYLQESLFFSKFAG